MIKGSDKETRALMFVLNERVKKKDSRDSS